MSLAQSTTGMTPEAIASTLNGITVYTEGDNLTALEVNGPTITTKVGYFAEPTSRSVATANRAETTLGVAANNENSLKITAANNQGTGYVIGANKTAEMTVGLTVSGNKVTLGNNINSTQITKTIGTAKTAATYTPGTTDQTINSGYFLTGAQTIKGDADLVAGNIKSGVQIFGVTGTYTGEAPKIKDGLYITPSASDQSFDAIDEGYAGYAYVSVTGDADLVAGNIKSGVNIFGVTGTYEGGGSYLNAESYTF